MVKTASPWDQEPNRRSVRQAKGRWKNRFTSVHAPHGAPGSRQHREIEVVEHTDHFELVTSEGELLRSHQSTSGSDLESVSFPPTRDAARAAAGEEMRRVSQPIGYLYCRWNSRPCPLRSMLRRQLVFFAPVKCHGLGEFSTARQRSIFRGIGSYRDARRPSRRRVSVLRRRAALLLAPQPPP